jgi:glycosyltransferase involved in cell wall biosynthesis
MKVMLVDPSLFTAPYNAALTGGLEACGVEVAWARRDLRKGEDADLRSGPRDLTFYHYTDGPRRRTGKPWKAVKGLEHALGLRRLEARSRDFDVVHFQWAPLPGMDAPAMARIARTRPVVLTVHDTEAFNGAGVSALQRHGFDTVFHAAHHLIVHTEKARATLVNRGVDEGKISVIRHGPLALNCLPQPAPDKAPGRWRVVLFGRLQTYKGVDLLAEAVAKIPIEQRARLEIVVAGEPFMPLDPITSRIAELGLAPPDFVLRPGRLDDQSMADLLGSADAFVFPYRAIEASGVLFLVAGLRKWIIASDLGAFSDTLGPCSGQGTLLPVGDVAALAQALVDSIGQTPSQLAASWAPDWTTIGAATRDIYERLLASPPGGRGQ